MGIVASVARHLAGVSVSTCLFVTALGFALHGGWAVYTWWERYVETAAWMALSAFVFAYHLINAFKEVDRYARGNQG